MRRALAAAVVVACALAAPAEAARTVVIKGRGWGHGIGMSQYGALGRAEAGHSARRILRHYYRGTRIRRTSVPRKVRVGLIDGRGVVHLRSRARRAGGGRVVIGRAASGRRIASGGAGDRWRAEASGTGGIRLYRNGVRVKRRGRTVFGKPDRPLAARYAGFGTLLRIRQKGLAYAHGKLVLGTYRGACRPGFCLRVVLKLSMQKYLLGLGEMPASWPAAALRAQAIAGRTYALNRIRTYGQHRYPCDCAVYDGSGDQVYIGDARRTGSGAWWDDWRSAVARTRGLAVVRRGRPIQALYSSSSGGHTENNENVWGGTALPYLRGVRDRFDGVDDNPNFRWRVEMRWKRLSAKLDRAFGTGKLVKVSLVRPFGVSGRVTVATPTGGGVRIAGSARTVRVDGWALRSALDLKDTWFRIRVRRAAGPRA
ncbi:MAG TPA: SpoIID/LytB domain-containing protein [Actinomycetota bacterium]|nr:SpoIID/LytB domain-containing protein [Actinomycetota bacterium]HEX2236760.1 SpoIID/LytB domain-containing protein [Actinomycetota bacterium]